MNIVKFLLVVLSALIDLLLSRMNEIEKQGNNDSDGVPLDPDYNTLGYCVASFRDVCKELTNYQNDRENEIE